jgi:CheY-like chemotaxis protein
VIDTGCGIAESERHLVFEEFYRGGGAGDEGEPGLGLGLSIVQRMATALDHALVLDSRLRHGTRVSLSVPIGASPTETMAGPAPIATRLTGARVLIVENDPATADALRRLLQNWDAEVSVHRDLAGVAERVAAGQPLPDVLILDYHLDHGACGLDVASYLRGVAHSALPVIVTTADHSPGIEADVAMIGAELMHKPIKPAQLRALLTHMLA